VPAAVAAVVAVAVVSRPEAAVPAEAAQEAVFASSNSPSRR